MEREKKERAERRAKKEEELRQKEEAKRKKEEDRKAKKRLARERGQPVSSDTDDFDPNAVQPADGADTPAV